MSFILSAAAKDLRRWWRDPIVLLVWLGIPLLIGGLITSLMSGGGSGARPTGVLLVVDQDDSLVSRAVTGMFGQGELAEMITLKAVSIEEGRTQIEAGDASALLVIPEGFGEAWLRERPATLTLRTNPAQKILPQIITEGLELLLDAGFYAQRAFGEEIKIIADWRETDREVELGRIDTIVAAVRGRLESAKAYLLPPAVTVELVETGQEADKVSLALLFLPGIVLMAVMFTASGLASDIWEEREQGTLRRLSSSPQDIVKFLLGKTLAATLVLSCITGITLVLGFALHGIAWSRLAPALAWTVLSGAVLFLWFAAVQMLAATRRAAGLISSIIVFPLLMAGGSFFPLAALPDWIAAFGRLTPNGFVAEQLTAEITSAAGWAIPPASWGLILLIGIAGLGVAATQLSAGFARR
jgi:ABC-type Na+ efflux pump permease subunit